MIIACDLDGTLCTQEDDFNSAQPIQDRIRSINAHHWVGETIVIHTARNEGWRDLTIRQLRGWGVQYDQLVMDKVFAHIYVDDRAQSDTEFFDGS